VGGVVALAAGGVAAFVLRSESAAVTTLIGGFVLVIVALILPRLSELGFGADGFTLKLTADARDAGAPTVAATMESTELGEYATAYALVNAELRADPRYDQARVHLQDSLVRRARAVAFANKIPAVEVQSMFRDGSPVLRVLSIGMMQGDPSTADAALLAKAISEPRSANEQYQALVLIRQTWPRWTREDRELFQHRVSTTDFPPASDRSVEAAELLSLPIDPRVPERP
jgi:hypothetical protein